MKRNYTITRNMAIKVGEGMTHHYSGNEDRKMTKKELKLLLAIWKEEGFEYMVNKRHIVVMQNTYLFC